MKIAVAFVILAAVKWGDGGVVLLEGERHFASFAECSEAVRTLDESRPQSIVALVCGEKVVASGAATLEDMKQINMRHKEDK